MVKKQKITLLLVLYSYFPITLGQDYVNMTLAHAEEVCGEGGRKWNYWHDLETLQCFGNRKPSGLCYIV